MPDYFDLPPSTYSDEPEPDSRDYQILQWAEERLSRGITFLESQIGYDKIDTNLNEIFSQEKATTSSYVPGPKNTSATTANLVAKIAEDLTAMLTDTRYFWKYSSFNQKYQKQAELSNKAGLAWYTRRMIDLRIGDVVRYYTIAGTGIAHFYYSRALDDFMIDAEDPRNVFPIDPISYHTFQESSGVIIRHPRTPDWVKEEFGKIVKPDTAVKGSIFTWLTRALSEGPGERGGPLSKRKSVDSAIPGTPTVFVNTMYLRDKRSNTRKDLKDQFNGKTKYMGEWRDGKPQNPWSYPVPVGAPLYPFNRMIVWGGGVLLYDGPAPYWHAQFPVIKFTLNPWPKSWFGKAPLTDCVPLNRSINSNLRVIDDHSAQVAQPGALGDRNVSRAEMNKLNTRAAGYKVRTNLASGKGIQIQTPPPLDSVIWEAIKWCEDKMLKISGVADPSNMAQLAQIPSDDTIDTIMKAMTPGVRLRSRALEGSYKEIAHQFLYNFWEWDTLSRRIEQFGPGATTKEDFDYEPGTGIPDDVPDGEMGDVAKLYLDNPRPMYLRAKAMLRPIVCNFDPSSLLNSAAQQELMKYFMLAKMGYMSVFTLMEKMGIMNYAPANQQIPDSEIERLQLQQQLGIGMIANAQGRKATDQAPPAMGQNAAGPTITTS
jgi:hypothetical protein